MAPQKQESEYEDTDDQHGWKPGWEDTHTHQQPEFIEERSTRRVEMGNSGGARKVFSNVVLVVFMLSLLLSVFGYETRNGTFLKFLILAGISGVILLILRLTRPRQPRFTRNFISAAGRKHNYPIQLRGIVKGFDKRTDTGGGFSPRQKQVWNFRIECYENGMLQKTIPVEMIGNAFRGWINEGDEVEVDRWQPGTLLKTKQVWNHTNGSAVRAINNASPQMYNWIFFLIVLVGLIILLISQS